MIIFLQITASALPVLACLTIWEVATNQSRQALTNGQRWRLAALDGGALALCILNGVAIWTR